MLIQILVVLGGLLVLAGVLGWLGLQVKAARFPALVGTPPRMIPIPQGLPPSVERFARALFGDSCPDVQSAMVLGRATLAPTGLPMPSRFRFYYDAARSSYYHDIEVSWFRLPIMRIHERNLDGHTRLDLAFIGKVDDQPRTNRAAIQGYWSEVLAWVPSIALTDPRLRWEAVDEVTAWLHLPGLEAEEAFTVRFDAATGLMHEIETLRYQSEEQAERWRWLNRILGWGQVNGLRVPVRAQTQWQSARPWATWEVEQVVLNIDVSARLAQFGRDVL